VPESVAANLRRRSYTIAAGADIEDGAEGVLFAQGGVAGGHALYLQDGRLHYMYNWLAEEHQQVTSDRPVEPGRHLFTAEFDKTGADPETGSALGTLTLFVDTEEVGRAPQPGAFWRRTATARVVERLQISLCPLRSPQLNRR
jgi:arylsulfatase